MNNKLKIGIIGCGQIADAHLGEIALIPSAEVVAVCDLYELLAIDTAERYKVKNWFSDYSKMISEVQLDVIHLTTPPHTHLQIGSEIVKKGIHLYIEKPCCLSTDEVLKLIDLATENNALVCAGFSQINDLASVQFNSFVENGMLGDVVHIESYYGNSLDGNFSRVFLRTTDHWIHRLPGKLFQNIISHALYHVVPLLPGEIDDIACFSFDRSDNKVLQDELRVMLRSGNVTGYITFTSAVKPVTQFMRVYGTKAIIEVDFTNHMFNVYDSKNLPGPLLRVINGVSPGIARIKQGMANAKKTLKGNDRFFWGMGKLFEKFYDNVLKKEGVPPIPYNIVIRTSSLLDQIVNKCNR